MDDKSSAEEQIGKDDEGLDQKPLCDIDLPRPGWHSNSPQWPRLRP